MAHELDNNAVTGKKSMFSVNETPWHREGVILNAAPSLDEALVLAGADYDVELREVRVQDDANPAGLPASIYRGIVRADTNELFSMVTKDYKAVQNRDAFGVLRPLLDKGVAHLETGGALRGGRDAWMLVRFDVKDPVVQEVFADEVIPFGLVTNNHAGEKRATVQETPIRVVCANTLAMASEHWARNAGTGIAVAHRGDATVKMVEAAEKMFAGIVERYRTIAEQYRAMKARELTPEEFGAAVLDQAAPLPKKAFTPEGDHLTGRGYEAALDAAVNRRQAIEKAWTGGKGHTGDHSAWEAYNAAVEVIDHDTTLFLTRGSRVASLLGGRLRERKAMVLSAVSALVQVSSN